MAFLPDGMTAETIALLAQLDQARFDTHATGNYARRDRLGLTYDRLQRGQITEAEALAVLNAQAA